MYIYLSIVGSVHYGISKWSNIHLILGSYDHLGDGEEGFGDTPCL